MKASELRPEPPVNDHRLARLDAAAPPGSGPSRHRRFTALDPGRRLGGSPSHPPGPSEPMSVPAAVSPEAPKDSEARHAESLRQGERCLEQEIGRLRQALDRCRQNRRQRVEITAEKTAELAAAIVGKILKRDVTIDPEPLRQAIRQELEPARQPLNPRIRMHPADEVRLLSLAPDIVSRLKSDALATCAVDPGIGEGECRLDVSTEKF